MLLIVDLVVLSYFKSLLFLTFLNCMLLGFTINSNYVMHNYFSKIEKSLNFFNNYLAIVKHKDSKICVICHEEMRVSRKLSDCNHEFHL